TNVDPVGVDYPIPGNDDAIRSCELVIRTIGEAVLESATAFRKAEAKRRAEEEERRRAEEERARREAEERARREAEAAARAAAAGRGAEEAAGSGVEAAGAAAQAARPAGERPRRCGMAARSLEPTRKRLGGKRDP